MYEKDRSRDTKLGPQTADIPYKANLDLAKIPIRPRMQRHWDSDTFQLFKNELYLLTGGIQREIFPHLHTAQLDEHVTI